MNLLCQLDQVVGHPAHRGHDGDDLVAFLLRRQPPLRDVFDPLRIPDRRAAVFLDDQCHRMKLRETKHPPPMRQSRFGQLLTSCDCQGELLYSRAKEELAARFCASPHRMWAQTRNERDACVACLQCFGPSSRAANSAPTIRLISSAASSATGRVTTSSEAIRSPISCASRMAVFLESTAT